MVIEHLKNVYCPCCCCCCCCCWSLIVGGSCWKLVGASGPVSRMPRVLPHPTGRGGGPDHTEMAKTFGGCSGKSYNTMLKPLGWLFIVWQIWFWGTFFCLVPISKHEELPPSHSLVICCLFCFSWLDLMSVMSSSTIVYIHVDSFMGSVLLLPLFTHSCRFK